MGDGTCETCGAWCKGDEEKDEDGFVIQRGECRLNAPTFLPTGFRRGEPKSSGWPETAPDDWCAQWKEPE